MLSIWSCPKNCCLVKSKMQQVLMHLSEMNRLHRVYTIITFGQAGIKSYLPPGQAAVKSSLPLPPIQHKQTMAFFI